MFLIRTIAALHLLVYLGIMWYGWQSYKLLRKPSWKVMGFGFGVLLVYRIRQLIRQLNLDYTVDPESTLLPFVGAMLLLIAFWMMSREHVELIHKLSEPLSIRSGAQPVEYWLSSIRSIVREEVAVLKTNSKE
jgi:CDP-diglyceride synthetase